jgi:hypothetical protein
VSDGGSFSGGGFEGAFTGELNGQVQVVLRGEGLQIGGEKGNFRTGAAGGCNLCDNVAIIDKAGR